VISSIIVTGSPVTSSPFDAEGVVSKNTNGAESSIPFTKSAEPNRRGTRHAIRGKRFDAHTSSASSGRVPHRQRARISYAALR